MSEQIILQELQEKEKNSKNGFFKHYTYCRDKILTNSDILYKSNSIGITSKLDIEDIKILLTVLEILTNEEDINIDILQLSKDKNTSDILVYPSKPPIINTKERLKLLIYRQELYCKYVGQKFFTIEELSKVKNIYEKLGYDTPFG